MIKIIKEGQIPQETKTIYTAECKNCGCIFEFEHEDIISQEKRINGNITIQCPCCKNKIVAPLNSFSSREGKVGE